MTDDSPDLTMTPRQSQVAELAAQGLGYPDIAKALGISRHTARKHVLDIATRLPDQTMTPLRRVMAWALTRQRSAA